LNCPGCGNANRDGARFCIACGASLALRCPSCGNELPTGARFCDGCGSPVTAEPKAEPVAAARKVVTVLFADMTGSTALEEQMDAEAVRTLLDRIYAALRKDVEGRGGRVVKFTGDGLMAAFGVPDVGEDDALDRHLEVTDFDPSPIAQFQKWYQEAWDARVPDANAMVLATSTVDVSVLTSRTSIST
jgi:class 3 adenylate cyclase